jgi:hypothetical protein
MKDDEEIADKIGDYLENRRKNDYNLSAYKNNTAIILKAIPIYR